MATFQGSTTGPARRLTLADARQGGSGLPARIVFYGPPGVGKTSFAAHAPAPLFVLSPGETGVQTLIDAKLLPAELPSIEIPEEFGWMHFLGIIEALTNSEHPYKTIVIDTINGMEKLANAHVCRTDFGGDWGEKGFIGYGRGHAVVAGGEWLRMLSTLDRLRAARKVRLILLGHVTVSNVNNPAGPDYAQYRPAFDGKAAWERTCEWADMVLFGTVAIEVDKGRGDSRAKAKGGTQRTLYTELRAGWTAKNRHGLPPAIDMGDTGRQAWENFVQALRDGRSSNTTTN